MHYLLVLLVFHIEGLAISIVLVYEFSLHIVLVIPNVLVVKMLVHL